jgi:hypothetical protein
MKAYVALLEKAKKTKPLKRVPFLKEREERRKKQIRKKEKSMKKKGKKRK